MTTHPYFGHSLQPQLSRAEQLATLRIGQLVRLRTRIVDRFPLDEHHQLRVEHGSLLRIVALAGHSGDHARYRFEILDDGGRPTGLWNTTIEEHLEAVETDGVLKRLRARLGGALTRAFGGA